MSDDEMIRIVEGPTGWIVHDGGIEVGPFFSREEARETADQLTRLRRRLALQQHRGHPERTD